MMIQKVITVEIVVKNKLNGVKIHVMEIQMNTQKTLIKCMQT